MARIRLRYNHRRLGDALEHALDTWGQWRAAPVPGLGYANMSVEAKLYLSPGRATEPNQGPKYEMASHEVREVEAITHRWAEEGRSQLTLALWCCWVQGMPYDRSALVLGVSQHDFGEILKTAHEVMAKCLRTACYHERRRYKISA
jgi:hypothetical protein